MPPETVRVSEEAKQQLSRLKRRTGIKQWNVLCRWAVCRSLAEETPPVATRIPADSNVEMTWRTFAGPWGDVLWELVLERCRRDGVPASEEAAAAEFRLHLHRGIGYLAGDPALSDVDQLLGLAVG